MQLLTAALVVLGSHVVALLVLMVVALGWAYMGSWLSGVDPNAPIQPVSNPPFSPVAAALTTASITWFMVGWIWWLTLYPALLLLSKDSWLWQPWAAAGAGGLLGVAFTLLVVTGGMNLSNIGQLFSPESLVFIRNGLLIGVVAWMLAARLKLVML